MWNVFDEGINFSRVAPVNGSAMMTDAAEAWAFAKCHWIGRENLHRKPWFFPANTWGLPGFLIFPEKTNPMRKSDQQILKIHGEIL